MVMDHIGPAADPTQKMAFKHIFLEKESKDNKEYI